MAKGGAMCLSGERKLKVPAAVGIGLAMFATLAMAQAAQASTIHACVKPESGQTRIVGSKTRCHHGEHRLSWNTAGPRGATGSKGATGSQGGPGPEGRAGADGAGTSFEAASEEVELPKAASTTLITKVLPPGSYVISAKTIVEGESTAKGVAVGLCELTDQPGTTGTGGAVSVDVGTWDSPLGENSPTKWLAASTLSLQGSLKSNVTTLLRMYCIDFGETLLRAHESKMRAVTVTAIS
jgi:hypothetical protein